MTTDSFHKNTSSNTPPPNPVKLLPVLEKSKTMYKTWMEIHRNVERRARFGLGTKIDILFLDILELLRKAAYASIDKKLPVLDQTLQHLDTLRFFFQLLWETRLVSNEKYISLAPQIEELGRMVGGWRKGLLNKTSALKTEERKQ